MEDAKDEDVKDMEKEEDKEWRRRMKRRVRGDGWK